MMKQPNTRPRGAQSKAPNRKAAALRYDMERDVAPEVTASGQGFVAERILELARATNVPVYEDPALVEALSRLKIGEAIPRELYEVVAEVLAFIARVDRGSGGRP